MDNHNLVPISILKNHEKDAIFVFTKQYAWKNFRIWPYAMKYFFSFENVFAFFLKYFGENRVF